MGKQEIWKPIPDIEGYEVSDRGRVRSFFARTGRGWNIVDTPQRVLKPSRDPFGYPGVNLRRASYKKIHWLVLLAFIGRCPDGLEVCHNNDIPDDNRLENLRYDTHSENLCDVARNSNRFLSIEDVKDIRLRRTAHEGCRQIARDYGVSLSTISDAARGRKYKHVDAKIAPASDHRKKLTPEKVLIIKWLLLNNNIARYKIAERFGVSPSMITLIAKGARWAYVSSACD